MASPVQPMPDTMGFLLGDWLVRRSVEDLRNGVTGSFSGRARVRSAGECRAIQDESGTLVTGGRRLASRRRTLYVGEREGAVAVRFEDGRPFHLLDLRTGGWRAEHRCGEDLYLGAFAVLSAQGWQVTWLVTGPRKHEVVSTELWRLELSGHEMPPASGLVPES
ncbi:MAG: DUF6314 family protein [Acidimicrobiales bacterium]